MHSWIANGNLRQWLKVGAVLAISVFAIAAGPAQKQLPQLPKERYLSPIEIASSPDGRVLYIVCQDSDEVRLVEPQSGKVTAIVRVGRMPRGVVLSRDGRRLLSPTLGPTPFPLSTRRLAKW